MKVAKFGGSSLASSNQLQKVIDIIRGDSKRRAVVVSAPGKRFADDRKVTDLLIDYANVVLKKANPVAIQHAILARYQEIATGFNLPAREFQPIHDHIMQLPDHDYPSADYLLDAFKAAGEDNNAKLIAAILNHLGMPSHYLSPREAGLLVSATPGDAQVLPESYAQLAAFKKSKTLLIIPGFFGYTKDGQICTFSRGGSDITGAIFARAFKAELYENFTDVDAIYAASPNIVAHPAAIEHLTFREMRELSYAGFSVFHDEALIPAIEGGVSVRVKNTNHPLKPGTLISARKIYDPKRPISGIASDTGFLGIYIRKYLMNKQVGFVFKVLQILAEYGISFEHIPSGIDDITIVIRERELTPELEPKVIKAIKEAIHPDDIRVIHHYALVMIVGEGIQDHIGMMAKATNSIAQAGVSIVTLDHGASPVSIMFGVREKDEYNAVRGLYKAFFNTETA
ncbi:aspartate kinase [Loigolactobacillus coryniformis]|uniref:aspartate kinase n=1 Tax=Loigolactobacillus coryniformis TaxID=1610 RepID=UPI002341B4C1|nr:aspartate kinase [Loigolactobacillus coryniformis]MDC4186799.1 aspartate kinase [Loigolactobacillus coryniformis]